MTKATFYKHFGSKDNLITEYLEGRHLRLRERVNAHASDVPAGLAVRSLVDSIVDDLEHPGFRGGAFIVAAGEFANPEHPVRVIVAAHRDWVTSAFTALLERAGIVPAGEAADEILLAVDGALAGGYAGSTAAATAALTRTVDRILGPHGALPVPPPD